MRGPPQLSLSEVLASPPLRAELLRRLQRKRLNAAARDGGVFVSLPELVAILEGSSGRCPDCDVEMLFAGWEASCLRQFSLDRLDDAFVHAPGNLRFCCYACNVAGGADILSPCRLGCHAGSAEGVAFLCAARDAERESVGALCAALLAEGTPAEAGPSEAGDPEFALSATAKELARAAHLAIRPAHKRRRALEAGQAVAPFAEGTPLFTPKPRFALADKVRREPRPGCPAGSGRVPGDVVGGVWFLES